MTHPTRPLDPHCPHRRSCTLWVLLALQGCSGTPRTTPAAPTPAGTAAAPAARSSASLTSERQWLQSWFAGTPVVIDQRRDGAVQIEIPREFCFDTGRSAVKPALAAVLDKVAQSLHRIPQARVSVLAAPGDGATATPLPLQRATQIRAHLLSHGVQAAQLGNPSRAEAGAVQLQLELVAL